MERKVTKLEHSHTEVLVTVDEQAWKEAQNKSFKKLAANVTVKGFRKGKAPEHLVKAQIDPVKMMNDAVDSLLPTIYRDIVEVDQVKPYAQPKVDLVKVSDTELEIKFTIVTAPEVTLGAYTGLKVGHNEVKVEEKDVDSAIEAMLKQNSTLVVKEGASEVGDTVVIDFVGSVDGVEFEGGKGENHELELGSNTFIPGFEDQLVGHVAGDHVDVNVTFPENYTEELKGKKALFKCIVHDVKMKKTPALDDEFVKEQNIKEVETVDQLKTYKKEELLRNKEKEEKRSYLDKVMELIVKESKIDIPEEIIETQVGSRKQDVEKQLSQSGISLEQYIKFTGMTEEKFLENLREQSQKDVSRYVVMEEIAKTENLTISQEEVDFEYAKIADQYQMKVEDVKKALGPQEEEFRNNLKMQRVEELLLTKND